MERVRIMEASMAKVVTMMPLAIQGLHIPERDLGLQWLQRDLPLEVSPKVWELMDLLHDLPKATTTMIAMVTAIILPNPKAFRKVRDQKDEDHHQIQVMKFHLHLLQ